MSWTDHDAYAEAGAAGLWRPASDRQRAVKAAPGRRAIDARSGGAERSVFVHELLDPSGRSLTLLEENDVRVERGFHLGRRLPERRRADRSRPRIHRPDGASTIRSPRESGVAARSRLPIEVRHRRRFDRHGGSDAAGGAGDQHSRSARPTMPTCGGARTTTRRRCASRRCGCAPSCKVSCFREREHRAIVYRPPPPVLRDRSVGHQHPSCVAASMSIESTPMP